MPLFQLLCEIILLTSGSTSWAQRVWALVGWGIGVPVPWGMLSH